MYKHRMQQPTIYNFHHFVACELDMPVGLTFNLSKKNLEFCVKILKSIYLGTFHLFLPKSFSLPFLNRLNSTEEK